MEPNQEQSRLSNTLGLVLSYGPIGLVRATARAIQARTLRVQTGAVTLETNGEVEVVFTTREGRRSLVHRFTARVAHSGNEGTTLVLDDTGSDPLGFLRPLIGLPATPT